MSHTPQQMFDLVVNVPSYPEFLPGCTGARVESREEDEIVASLDLAKGPLHTGFTTRNRLEPPERMGLKLVNGPFQHLQGEWRFAPLGDAGCRVSLTLEFQFSNAMKDWLLGTMFEATCNQLVDAFVERARRIYG